MKRGLLNDIIQTIRNKDFMVSGHYWRDRVVQLDRPLPTSIVVSISDDVPEIIEHYPSDPQGPSCLILGENGDGNSIHSVVGYSTHPMTIVTAYYPDENIWINKRKRRRK